MARIGDYIDPSLNRYDPTPYLQAQGNATRTIGAGISGAIGDFKDKLADQREKKNEVKATSKLIESYINLFPDAEGSLAPIRDALKDEDLPVSERHLLGKNAGSVLAAYLDEKDQAANRDFQRQQIEMEGRRVGIAEAAAGRDQTVFDKSLAMGNQAQEANKFIAPSLLEQAIATTRAVEQSGGQPMIPSERLQQALQMMAPQQQMQIAQAALVGLPQQAQQEFRDIPITIDGQPGTATAAYNPKTGTFDVVPVRQAGTSNLSTALPEPLAAYAGDFERLGTQYGVDPKVLAAISMHETGGGTSSAFRNKNNAMGVSTPKGVVAMESVPASIEKMARLLGSTESGPYKNAATIEQIANIYAPVGAGNDPNNLNQHWKKGVAGYLAQLGGDPSAPIRITPGAVKGGATPKTPAELQKEQLEIQKLQGELAGQEASQRKEADLKQAASDNATDTIRIIDELVGRPEIRNAKGEIEVKGIPEHPGFRAAVGQGFGKAMNAIPGVGKWLAPETGTDRKGALAIIDQLKGRTFLDKIQQMRGLGPLSDAEGARVQAAAARLDPDQGEKDFKASLEELRQSLQRLAEANKTEGVGPTESSAAAKLRALRGQ